MGRQTSALLVIAMSWGLIGGALAQIPEPAPVPEPAPEAIPDAAPAALAAPDATEHVRIIWFGRSGGVSSHVGRNRAHEVLGDRVGDALEALVPVGEGPRVFERGGRLLFRENGLSVNAFHAFLAAPPFRFEPVADQVKVLISPFEIVFEHPPAADTPLLDLLTGDDVPLPALRVTHARLRRWVNADGDAVLALELPEVGAEPLVTDPAQWELRFAFEGRGTPRGGTPRRLFNVGRPFDDGPRRLLMLEALRAEAPERTLVLAAGEDIEHYSFVETGTPDLQRPNTWQFFHRIGLTALVPAGAEAAFGLDRLQREAQQSEVPLVAANIGGDAPIAGWRLVPVGSVRVLVIGLVNPDMPTSARLRAYGARPIEDPGAAVERAVAEATAQLGRRPDLVVALGTLSGAARQQVLARSDDVDVLLTDFTDRGVVPEEVLASFDAPDLFALRARDRYPVVVVPAGRARIGVLDLRLTPAAGEGGALRISAAHSRALTVPGDQPADPAMAAAVQRVRQAAYGPAQVQLLPDLGPGIEADPALRARFEADPRVQRAVRLGGTAPGRLTADLWRQLVANVVREAFDGEVVLIPRLSFPWGLTGPVSRLEAAANLNVPDEVLVFELDAAALRRLVASPVLAERTVSGLGANADGPLVLGRPIADRERYRVVTTDAVRADPRLAGILPASARARFVARRAGWQTDDAGTPVKLRDAALDALTSLSQRQGAPALLDRMRPVGDAEESRWAVDFQKLELLASRYSTFGSRDAYAEVRETRVTTSENTALALRGGAFLRRDSAAVDWVTGARVDFATADYEDDGEQETADSLRLSTELQAHALSLGSGVPFVNLGFETEITPTTRIETEPVTDAAGAPATDADGNAVTREVEVDNPRKKRAEAIMGLLWSGKLVTAARVGGVLAHDFASMVRAPEVGALASLSAAVPLDPFTWTFDGEARYHVPGIGANDASQLGVVLQARTALLVPVVGGLSLGLFLDLYGYRGQVSDTSDPGASLVSGVGVSYDRFLKPAY